MEEETKSQENTSDNVSSSLEEDKNSIGEGGPVIGSDVPTYPDKVYRSVKGMGAIEDIYDSGVVRSSVSAKEDKDIEGNTNSKGKKIIYWTQGAEGKSHMLPKDMYLIEAPYEVAKDRLVKKEDISAIYSKLENNEVVNLLENPEKLESDIVKYRLEILSAKIEKEKTVIDSTTSQVNEFRHEQLNLSGEETDIPSINANKKHLEEFDAEKAMLLQKLSEIVHDKNVAHKYYDQLSSIAEEKIKWINSTEFERRLKLQNLSDEQVVEAKAMLTENIESGKPIVLPTENFEQMKNILAELANPNELKKVSVDDLKGSAAFHMDKKSTSGTPNYLGGSIVLEEKTKPSIPPLKGEEANLNTGYIDEVNTSHEMGHLTQDGLLESENFKSVNLQTKENSPDPEYVGNILETDTRIRSMFRELEHVFDPQKEPFTQEHIDLLRKRSTKNQDIKDLFDHYDDETIIKLANELPAI